MYLITGLGNPGKKYEKTRHNAGFRAADELQNKFGLPGFKFDKKLKTEITRGEIGGEKIIVAKPQTFMNLSGEAVAETKKFFKIKNKNIFIVHDDIDLPLGALRIKTGGSSGGHNGIKSIIENLGTEEFIRIKIGIGATENSTTEERKNKKTKIPAEKFVLQSFTKDENKILSEVIKKTAEAVEVILKDGTEKAMNKFN